MPCVFYLAYVLQFIIHGFNDRTLPEHQFVIKVHQGIFHVPLDFRDEVDVIHKELLEEILTDISPVCEEFPKSLSVKCLSFSGARSSTLPGVSCH